MMSRDLYHASQQPFKRIINLLNTLSLAWTAFEIWLGHWLTDSEGTKSVIPSQLRPSPITLSWVNLIFMLFVLSAGNKNLANSL